MMIKINTKKYEENGGTVQDEGKERRMMIQTKTKQY